ncbi:MAG TPA: TIGR00282 family metallophosphoesterase [bacterium]|nr:TIGR00282 family metallophosphoesterase [bacterium]
MNVLVIGDIHGKPGRRILRAAVPRLRKESGAALVIANGENAAGGAGITADVIREIFDAGVDVITGGNHTWHNREAYETLDAEPRLLRPANYPPGAPGHGSTVIAVDGTAVGVLNLQGRIFMQTIDDPFRAARAEADRLRERAPVVIVDFHAEATSEKIALGWYLDGRVSAVIGTHTHVQTADERVLPGGTAYISDVGMTGPRDGVIGMAKDDIIERFLTQLPVRFTVASGPAQLNAVALDVDEESGRARAIRRIREFEEE